LYSSFLQNAENGEIEIDIDALDTPTLRHLEKYVKDCSAPVTTANKKRSRNKLPAAPVQNELQQGSLFFFFFFVVRDCGSY